MPDFLPPNEAQLQRDLKPLLVWRALTRPVFEGMERVPLRGPRLFVGNHTIYGVLDSPLLWLELFREKDVFLRFLGDHVHFQLPIWRDLLQRYGVVRGTRENCGRLLAAGEPVAVFPGGGREVAKRHGEKYKLIWKQRLGFARMAIQYGCQVVPFSAVGAEEALDIMVDAEQILASPLGSALRALSLRTDVLLPIVRGVGVTPLPRPERMYFRFGPAIDARAWAGRHEESAACEQLRDQVRDAVQAGIVGLLARREQDPLRSLAARLKAGLRGWLGRSDP